MIPTTTARFEEVLVSVMPTPERSQTSSPRSRRTYDAHIYTNLEVPVQQAAAPPGIPEEIGGLRYRGIEQITVRWSRYEEYLRLFLEGEKASDVMRERLLEATSSGLDRLFEASWMASHRHVRIWWANESPELEDLPWELLVHGHPRTRFSFARGVPGDFAPLLPLQGPLRLALIGHQHASPYVREALESLQDHADLEVEKLEGGPYRALREAAARGFELVQLFADGTVSLGCEGILDIDGETLSPGELRASVSGSRVTVVALSPPATPRTVDEIPRVYSAFAHLRGGGAHAGTSLVAPVGPLPEWRRDAASTFWMTFYTQLARTLSVESALLEAQPAHAPLPVALFLRHRLGVEFSRRAPLTEQARLNPARVSAEVSVARDFLKQIRAVESRFPGEDRHSTTALVERESKRLDELEASSLEPWLKLDGSIE